MLPDGTIQVYKRISGLLKQVTADKFVSATEIASFVFCPVSYCIKKSFEDEPTKESKIGAELHKGHRLIFYVKDNKKIIDSSPNLVGKLRDEYNSDFFDDIYSSSIYYLGHDQSSKRYFKSSKGYLVGQPDYVFVNKEGARFIVEEKFRPLIKQSKAIKPHHKAQLASYILGLDELEARYGYLVYWYYDYENDKRTIKKCVVSKLQPAVVDRELVKISYQTINALNRGERLEFITSGLNAIKCANCVVNKFCGHKTGRFNEISIPYGNEYYGLVSAT